jgi:hypothetical protein
MAISLVFEEKILNDNARPLNAIKVGKVIPPTNVEL